MGSVSFGEVAAVPPLTRGVGEAVSRWERFRRGWLTFVETLKLALDALRAHKLRSFLTLLGVILAVLTLVSVMSVIAGLNFYVADRVANLGANVYLVDRFGIITSQAAYIKAQKRPLLTLDECERLQASMKLARAITCEQDHNVEVKFGNQTMQNTRMSGAGANFAEIRNLNVAQGRFFTQADVDHHSDMVFVGPGEKILPEHQPAGTDHPRADAHVPDHRRGGAPRERVRRIARQLHGDAADYLAEGLEHGGRLGAHHDSSAEPGTFPGQRRRSAHVSAGLAPFARRGRRQFCDFGIGFDYGALA